MRKQILIASVFLALLIDKVQAHCPLCTMGAAAAAGGAAWLGVSKTVIGLFVGAFAVSTGWWVSRIIKKRYIPFQRAALILFSFITTIWPMMSLMDGFYPLYISLIGSYGSLLNRTYLINLFLVGSLVGGIIVSSTPWMSSKITELRKGKMMPFQGILLTLMLLVVAGVAIQFINL